MISKRIAVIGAGPSGLVTTKELLEQGHRPVCFEQAPGLGGVFRYDKGRGSVWPTCRLTSSGLITAFSDFPVTDRRAAHMTVGELLNAHQNSKKVLQEDYLTLMSIFPQSAKLEDILNWRSRGHHHDVPSWRSGGRS